MRSIPDLERGGPIGSVRRVSRLLSEGGPCRKVLIGFVAVAAACWTGCAENSTDPEILGPPPGQLTASGSFIAGGQRVEELLAGGHSFTGCTDCHSAPRGVPLPPVDHDCADAGCHSGRTVNHPGLATCIDCHMPRATMAVSSVTAYSGDTRSHVIALRRDPIRRDSMFRTEGSDRFVEVGRGLTLDFACYGCHRDEQGLGGNFSHRTLRQLADKAPYIHEGPSKFVGVSACKPCHMGEAKGKVYEIWLDSPHAEAFVDLPTSQRENATCLDCHTTAWNRRIAAGRTPENLRGVQCEACHGPGSEYKRLGAMKSETLARDLGLIQPVEWTCRRCHTPGIPRDCWAGADRAPEFDYPGASRKIRHRHPTR